MSSPQAAMSIFDYPEMKKWQSNASQGAPVGAKDYQNAYGLTPKPKGTAK
jgi:hypothetical protein